MTRAQSEYSQEPHNTDDNFGIAFYCDALLPSLPNSLQMHRHVERAVVHCSITPPNRAVRQELKRHGLRNSHDTKPIADVSMRLLSTSRGLIGGRGV